MLKLDETRCIGCGICEDQCPFGSITMTDGLPVVGQSCN
ncbi:MAG: 4Fe-4S binding protein, partial [Desulfofustis sp. PB-SRB1]|nr:4Fe-4S binding protein [Desulfofustis sp. PB-SRB1]